jgi:hypothetical protein
MKTSALDGSEWSVSRPGRFTPGERIPVEVGWDSEPVWTLWRREKSLVPRKNWTDEKNNSIKQRLQVINNVMGGRKLKNVTEGLDNYILSIQ